MITTGRCSGPQPAITALIAIFSTVASPNFGAIPPITAEGSRSVACRARRTRSGVGGTIGKPSVQPRA
ncbi:MAG: hypothetical protein A3G24_12300 [Betaproteobacteria bacterium RIFCSPLOWO2_12_FULL_62_13]|nr:MAG: hypothetical protein A3G24_12300 [Betaproteobacteria bacterium RIFCSPLOWO2_12_FULL_62_13]